MIVSKSSAERLLKMKLKGLSPGERSYYVLSADGSRNLGGPYSKPAAQKRLLQVGYFKMRGNVVSLAGPAAPESSEFWKAMDGHFGRGRRASENPRNSKVKDALNDEAVRFKRFDDFAESYWNACGRGLYWVPTNEKRFRIGEDERKLVKQGRFVLYCSPALAMSESRGGYKYVAQVDTTKVPRSGISIVRNSGATKIRIIDYPGAMKVTRVLDPAAASKSFFWQLSILPSSKEELRLVWEQAVDARNERVKLSSEKAHKKRVSEQNRSERNRRIRVEQGRKAAAKRSRETKAAARAASKAEAARGEADARASAQAAGASAKARASAERAADRATARASRAADKAKDDAARVAARAQAKAESAADRERASADRASSKADREAARAAAAAKDEAAKAKRASSKEAAKERKKAKAKAVSERKAARAAAAAVAAADKAKRAADRSAAAAAAAERRGAKARAIKERKAARAAARQKAADERASDMAERKRLSEKKKSEWRKKKSAHDAAKASGAKWTTILPTKGRPPNGPSKNPPRRPAPRPAPWRRSPLQDRIAGGSK